MITATLQLHHPVTATLPAYTPTSSDFFLMIDDTHFLLIDNTYKLIIE